MAFIQNLLIPSLSFYVYALIFFSNNHLSLCFKPANFESVTDVHDLLPLYGFPKGLIPNAVKSYSLSDDGSFTVELDRPCYVHYDDVVYYDKHIKGKLTYGAVSDVSGIEAKQLFIWVPVTSIQIDSKSGMLEFYVGPLSKRLPAKQFETIPNCKSKASREESLVDSI
ncbi:hypothetical protein NMG60_11033845 [Bertholletia excelsa]